MIETMRVKDFLQDSRRHGRYAIGTSPSNLKTVSGYSDNTSGGRRFLRFSHMEVVVDDFTTVVVDFSQR